MSETQAVTILSRRFPGKRAFITGAASGLGRAIATELAAEGWQLGLLDVSAPRLAEAAASLRTAGVTPHTYAGDVADEAFVAASVGDFVRRAGGLDVMVNNAGVAAAGPVETTPPSDWRWITDINLFGVVWGCQAAVPHLRAAGSGLVLNVASSAGFAAAPQMSAYNATKAAVISLTEEASAATRPTLSRVRTHRGERGTCPGGRAVRCRCRRVSRRHEELPRGARLLRAVKERL